MKVIIKNYLFIFKNNKNEKDQIKNWFIKIKQKKNETTKKKKLFRKANN